MKDYEIKSYKRVHKYENPSDVEKGKIKKETTKHIKYRNKSKKLSDDLLRDIESLSDIDEFSFDEIEEIELKASKEKNNAKVHKERLKKLKKHNEFY